VSGVGYSGPCFLIFTGKKAGSNARVFFNMDLVPGFNQTRNISRNQTHSAFAASYFFGYFYSHDERHDRIQTFAFCKEGNQYLWMEALDLLWASCILGTPFVCD